MSLAKYKWNIRFGALREWISKSAWTDEDAQAFRDWLEGPDGTMERFKEEFFTQALPYIKGHPNAERLVLDIQIRDERSFLLAEALARVVDTILDNLEDCSALEELVLFDTMLGDKAVLRIAEMAWPNLKSLVLSSNTITALGGEVLANTRAFSTLEKLALGYSPELSYDARDMLAESPFLPQHIRAQWVI